MGLEDYFIDVKTLPDNQYGLFQLVFLGLVYGYCLMYASNLISDGSELLLLVPAMAGIVGSVVLPVLGAVPDGCMVLFSGLGENAQESLSVGIGALAGSTIMLLTIPWFLSVVGGRVNIDEKSGQPRYKKPKLDPPENFSLHHTGVTVTKAVHNSAYIVLITSIGYLLLQVPGLVYLHNTQKEIAAGEKNWAILGTVLAVGFFVWYLYLQYSHSEEDNTTQALVAEEFIREAIATKKITLRGFMVKEFEKFQERNQTVSHTSDATSSNGIQLTERTPLRRNSSKGNNSSYRRLDELRQNSGLTTEVPADFITYLERILKPFFKVYDYDNSGTIDIHELSRVFNDMGEHLTFEDISGLFKSFDRDNNGQIDYEEFVYGTAYYICSNKYNHYRRKSGSFGLKKESSRSASLEKVIDAYIAVEGGHHVGKNGSAKAGGESDSNEDENEDEDKEEMPEDIKDLSPDEQQSRIKWRAAYMMGLGSLILLIVSDPMVTVLGELGNRTGIPPFYIAFVAAPLASNASELIAAYNYAQKKTVTSISIALTTLEGAAVMNNTFVLGIFMMLIVTQNLAWEYFAETTAILFVEVAVACMAFKKKHTIFDAYLILSLYPISLTLVAVLEYVGWN